MQFLILILPTTSGRQYCRHFPADKIRTAGVREIVQDHCGRMWLRRLSRAVLLTSWPVHQEHQVGPRIRLKFLSCFVFRFFLFI